jgi:carbonic anhydrase/acetyltransferase-like protein (isoleucine patch superfamily)
MPILPHKGHWPTIAADAFIAPTATVVGNVTIESGASIWFGAVIRGDEVPIRIGRGSNVQDNCTIHIDEGAPCTIGEDCTIGHGAIVHGATLGDRVLIGMHATVLSHAIIGSDCVIAAGAVVPEGRAIPEGMLALGIPARPMRPTSQAERARAVNGAAHYRAYAHDYLAAIADAEKL